MAFDRLHWILPLSLRALFKDEARLTFLFLLLLEHLNSWAWITMNSSNSTTNVAEPKKEAKTEPDVPPNSSEGNQPSQQPLNVDPHLVYFRVSLRRFYSMLPGSS